MKPFEMVVLIVAIVVIAGVYRARHVGRRAHDEDRPYGETENQRLRDEVQALKERVAVLERIATDRTQALDQEIEKLRDR